MLACGYEPVNQTMNLGSCAAVRCVKLTDRDPVLRNSVAHLSDADRQELAILVQNVLQGAQGLQSVDMRFGGSSTRMVIEATRAAC
jgi:hypothetical protein